MSLLEGVCGFVLFFIPDVDQRWEGIHVAATDNQMKSVSLHCIMV